MKNSKEYLDLQLWKNSDFIIRNSTFYGNPRFWQENIGTNDNFHPHMTNPWTPLEAGWVRLAVWATSANPLYLHKKFLSDIGWPLKFFSDIGWPLKFFSNKGWPLKFLYNIIGRPLKFLYNIIGWPLKFLSNIGWSLRCLSDMGWPLKFLSD